MKKLLIVDNEEMLVEVLRMGFEARGVETIPAYDGEQALEIVTKDVHKEIGAILTDISMPKMNGWTLVREVGRIRPDISLMILSAESEARAIGQHMVEVNEISAAFDKAIISPTAFADKVLGVVGKVSKAPEVAA